MIEDMQQWIRQIREIVSNRLDLTRNISDDEIREVISDIVMEQSRQQYMSLNEKKTLMEGVFNSMRGLDVLQPLVDDPSITEIMINGPTMYLWSRMADFIRKMSALELMKNWKMLF